MTTKQPLRGTDVSSLARALSPSLRLKFERLLATELGLIFDDDDPVWCDAREVLITGGVRSGKSLRLAFRVLCAALNPATQLVWIVGPTYRLAQEEFRYVLEWTSLLGLVDPTDRTAVSTPKDGSRTLRLLTGCLIETMSGEHAQRLASVAPDFVVLCEPSQLSSDVYDAVLGRLLQKRGNLFMGGTLDNQFGRPVYLWYEDLARDWLVNNPPGSRERAFCLPTWSNRVDYPLGRDDPEFEVLRAKVGDYTFNRMYGGRPEGIENPCFPLLWEPDAASYFIARPDPDVMWYGGAIGVDFGRCVPIDTEILTRDGFKAHDEVQVGELIAAYDGTTNELRWEPLLDKVSYPRQPLVRIEQKGFRFSCTPNHAWPVVMARTGRIERRELHSISPWAHIRVAAPMRNNDGLDCSPAEAAVLGWLVTDGWVSGAWQEGKFSAVLSQKNYIDEMLADLDESGLPYTKHSRELNGVKCFHISSSAARDLFNRIGYRGKESLPMLVCNMSYEQRHRMYAAMLLADGHRGGKTFCQNEGPVLEAFYVLATLLGIRLGKSSLVTNDYPTDKVQRRVHISPTTLMSPMHVFPDGFGPTWCPVTSTGYWVARQGDQITVTGNTWEHPTASVVICEDSHGIYWVRDAWQGFKVDPTTIESVIEAQKERWNIWQGEVDPNQGYLGERLGFAVAPGGSTGGGSTTEMRITLTNGLLESRRLFFDIDATLVREVWSSMRSLRRIPNNKGQLRYERPLGDDLAQCVMYAVEFLRGPEQLADPVMIDAGSVRMRFERLRLPEHEGRI